MNKLFSLFCATVLIGAGCKQDSPQSGRVDTLSSFDRPAAGIKIFSPNDVRLDQAGLDQVLKLYAEISGRSIIRGAELPEVKVTFSNQKAMNAVEALQALDTLMAAHGIAMVVFGTHYMKAVPTKEATTAGGPVFEQDPERLPDSSSFVIYIVKVKSGTARQATPALAPFATLPNSIIAIGSGPDRRSSGKAVLPDLKLFDTQHDVLVLRDYSSSVRRMLQVLAKIEDK